MNIPTEFETHCFGRYLIDLPKGYKPSGTYIWGLGRLIYGNDANFKSVYITIKDEDYTPERFRQELQKYADGLKAQVNDFDKKSMLLAFAKFNDQAFGVRKINDSYGISLRSEIHQLVGKRYVILDEDSYPPPDSKGLTEEMYIHRNPAPAEARLKKVAASMRPVGDPLNSPPGFCYGGVIFNADQDNESGSFDYENPAMDLVKFHISYYAVLNAQGAMSDNLYERSKDIPLELRSTIDTLRKKDRAFSDSQAHELLARMNYQNIPQHVFHIQRYSTEGTSLAKPDFELSLESGVNDSPSPISDKQAIELWDKVVKSVRPRPGAAYGAKVSIDSHQCKSGEVCPKTGLWHASSTDSTYWIPHEMARIPPQFVQQGAPMPTMAMPWDKNAALKEASIRWTWVGEGHQRS